MSRGVEAFACIFCILLAAHVTLTSPVAELEVGSDEKAVVTVEGEGEGEEEEEEDDYDLPQIQPSPIPLDTPRFVVKLSDSNLLCFSIQGFELFTYNIITSENLIMNAFMNVSQYEDETWMRGHTDLGFVMKVKDPRVKSGVRLFKAVVDSRKRRAIMGGFGEVDMHNGAITFTVEDAHSDIESQESNNEMFRVVMDEPVAVVRAYSPDGKFFDVYVDDSSGLAQVETHGLIGGWVGEAFATKVSGSLVEIRRIFQDTQSVLLFVPPSGF